MNKRELFEKLAPLADDDDVVIALTFPKPDEGYTLGDDDASPSNDSPSEDEDEDEGVDNEDGTTTEFYPIEEVDVEEFTDDNNATKKVAFINLELTDDEDDADDEDDNDNSED